MPRRCTVCDHADRTAIDLALAADSGSLREIAGRWGLAQSSVQRHREAHLSPSLVTAQAAHEAAHGASILEQLHSLQARTLVQLERAERERAKPVDVAKIIRECRENLSTIGRLLGQFPKEGTTIDNRTQILALGDLTTDELRALAALGPARKNGSD